jgi:hypothetical protein
MSGGKGGSTTSEITIPDYIENAARANLAKADDISRVGYTPYYGADVAAFNPMQQASFQNTADTANAFGMATPTSGTDIMGNMGRPNVYADGITGYSSAPMFQDSVDTLNYLRPAQAGLIDSFFVNPNAGFDPTAEFQGRPGGSLMGRGMLDAPLVNTTDYGVDSAYYNQPMSAPAGGIAGQYQPTAGDYGSNSGYGTNYNPTAPAPAPVSGDLAGIRRNDNEDGIGGQGFVAPTAAEYEERANSYGRRIPSFIPGAGLINTAVAGSATTPEEIAYIRANPGQDDSLVSKVFGTGKYEPYDTQDVISDQVYASGVSGGRTGGDGYGDFNESGLGRNMNYDRFGNERTEMPDVPAGSAYWNSTTGNWTSKDSGLPVLSASAPADMAIQNESAKSQNDKSSSSDRGSCVIATHAVNSGGFSTKDKREAIVWCVNALHGKWWGEAIRRGYRYLGQKKIEQGKAREHYGEFKDYIAFANGKKRTVKGAIHFAARTAQFFAIGLVKKDI